MSDVLVGMIHDDFVNSRFLRALTGLNAVARPGEPTIYVESGGGSLDRGRNLLVQKFLQTDYPWLLQVDTDQFFSVEQFDRLRATADEVERPIVSGLYFANERPPRPAMYRWTDEGVGKSVLEWEEDEVIEVDGVGGGFLLVHRSVYEAMNHPDEYEGRAGSWFNQSGRGPNGQLLNEDSSFCVRAQAHGYRIYVDTGVFVGHIKSRILGWDPYEDRPET